MALYDHHNSQSVIHSSFHPSSCYCIYIWSHRHQIRWLLAEHHLGLSQNNTLVTMEGFYGVVKGYQPLVSLQALMPLVCRCCIYVSTHRYTLSLHFLMSWSTPGDRSRRRSRRLSSTSCLRSVEPPMTTGEIYPHSITGCSATLTQYWDAQLVTDRLMQKVNIDLYPEARADRPELVLCRWRNLPTTIVIFNYFQNISLSWYFNKLIVIIILSICKLIKVIFNASNKIDSSQ